MEIADTEGFMRRCAKVNTFPEFDLWIMAKSEGLTEEWTKIAD
jgi:hypothetical protein